MKICAVILLVLVASAQAFFMPNTGTQAAPQQSTPMGGNTGFPNPMQMQWLRQMLMTILPKILGNPALVQAFTGKPADAGAAAAAMPAANMFNPQPPPPAMGMGAPAGPGGFMPTNDRFKDMRIIELLQDPTIGLVNDPNVAHYIPPPGAMHFGFSLPDRAKDYIQTAVYQNAMRRRGQLSPLENELIHLIGDPIDVYHPATGYRPGGMGGFFG